VSGGESTATEAVPCGMEENGFDRKVVRAVSSLAKLSEARVLLRRGPGLVQRGSSDVVCRKISPERTAETNRPLTLSNIARNLYAHEKIQRYSWMKDVKSRQESCSRNIELEVNN
jgi:hypothetical protein